MSGYHKSPHSIPTLDDVPPEIWSTIIRYAADSGSGLFEYEMTPSEHADFLRGEERSQMKIYQENIRTRSYLTRVNKTWYEMAAPFLFEYISIRNGRKILALSKVLLRSQETAAHNRLACTLGWWTKRLDLHMREPNGLDASWAITQFASMIACFPNLRILTFSATGNGYSDYPSPSAILSTLSTTNSLKAIHWYTNAFRPSMEDWTDFLEHHTGLQSVRGPCYVLYENKISLKSLKALHPHPGRDNYDKLMIRGLSSFDLPNVRCFSWTDKDNLAEELQGVGAQLSVVQIQTELRSVNNFEAYRFIYSLIQNNCPNLVQINLDILSTPTEGMYAVISLGLIESLKTLGLSFKWSQISTQAMRRLMMEELRLVISNNTNITTIQFLAKENVECLRQHPWILKEGVQQFADLGVALKDHEGQALLEPQT